MKSVEVVAAVIVEDGRILATQRDYGEFAGGWEFPGGKIEAGESNIEALKREIREELDARIEVDRHLITVNHEYPNFHLIMHCYLCSLTSEMSLLEHRDSKWVSKVDINALNWLPADIAVVDALLESGVMR